MFSYMNVIHDDNDISGFWYLDSLVHTISNSKEFGFGWSDIDSMMNYLSNVIGRRVDIRNRYGNVVSNASIWNNDNRYVIQWCIWEDIVKIAKMRCFVFLIFAVCLIKRKTTREVFN